MSRLLLAVGLVAFVVACGDADLIRKANDGDAKAQYELSHAYREGKGVSVDLQSAYKWLRLSADGGYAEAQYELAKEFVVEAERNRPTAKLGVGTAIQYFSRNYGLAADMFSKAAEQGHARAEYELARLYFAGWGLQVNDAMAKEWAEKAKAQGVKEADQLLADLSAGKRPEKGFGEVRPNPAGGMGRSGVSF